MRQTVSVEEGFKPRISNRTKSLKGRPVFKWAGTLEGRAAKIIIGIYGDGKAQGAAEINRKFAKSGAGGHALMAQLLVIMPWFADLFKEATGNELKQHVVGCRYKMMYTKNGKPKKRNSRGVRSSEHYLTAEYLRPYVPYINDLVTAGKRVSRLGLVTRMEQILPLKAA